MIEAASIVLTIIFSKKRRFSGTKTTKIFARKKNPLLSSPFYISMEVDVCALGGGSRVALGLLPRARAW